MRTLAAIGLLMLIIAGPGSSAASSAKAGSPPDIPVGVVFASGKLTPLKAGVTYRASSFPLALRVTPPTDGWGGAQYKANLFSPDEIQRRHLKCSTSPAVCRPPYYGWVTIGQGPAICSRPIIVLSGFSQTPSVAATVTNLRTRGNGSGATSRPRPLRSAGSPGFSSARAAHRSETLVFVPFTPKNPPCRRCCRLGSRWTERDKRLPHRRPERPREDGRRPHRDRGAPAGPVRGLPHPG